MSDHEQFAQVAQRKRAIVSESLRSLTKNEQMSESLIFLTDSLIFRQKTSDSLRNLISEFPALENFSVGNLAYLLFRSSLFCSLLFCSSLFCSSLLHSFFFTLRSFTLHSFALGSFTLHSFAQNCSYYRATVSNLLSSQFKKSNREQITLIALYKRVTVIDLLPLLLT